MRVPYELTFLRAAAILEPEIRQVLIEIHMGRVQAAIQTLRVERRRLAWLVDHADTGR